MHDGEKVEQPKGQVAKWREYCEREERCIAHAPHGCRSQPMVPVLHCQQGIVCLLAKLVIIF